jgi:hypothetical protein
MANQGLASELQDQVRAARLRGEQYILSREAVEKILKSFLAGELSKEALAEWAEFFDANEDVDFEPERLVDIVFEMSSPEINEWMDDERARDLLLQLGQI